MEFNDLTDEQKAKARECTTTEELVALAETEGIELTDEQLNAFSGGWGNSDPCGEECRIPFGR